MLCIVKVSIMLFVGNVELFVKKKLKLVGKSKYKKLKVQKLGSKYIYCQTKKLIIY